MPQDSNAKQMAGSGAQAYESKTGTYFAGVRRDFLALLPPSGQADVLEIGCGFGETGAAALSAGLCRSYAGVELFPQAADVARTHLSEVLQGDVEHLDLPWPTRHFDAVLMSEVLEHLVDPWAVVKRIAHLMKPGAVVLASSPNVAQIRIVRDLLADRWDLADSGVMDRTHLRWFTQGTYRRMFEEAGIRVERVYPLSPPGPLGRIFNAVTLNRYHHLTMRQICLVGRKA